MVQPEGEPLVILLVEDNEAHAELVLRSLRDFPLAHSIYVVRDGEQALDFLFHRGKYQEMGSSPRPRFILLDIRLPKVDGLEVLKTIKETPGLMQIPVIILTSSSAETDVARSYRYHANSYVVKPLDFRKFNQLMNDIGAYWMGWNTIPLAEKSPDNRKKIN
jgi:two-component system, response regulator